MPYLGATLAAMACGWLVDAVLAPMAPVPLRVLIGFVVSTIAFYWSLQVLRGLRGR